MRQFNDIADQDSSIIHSLTLIASLICIVGFSLDMLSISLGLALDSIEWRMGFVQQLGERCIILLFGAALLCHSLQTTPARLKQIGWLCCVLGLWISLSSLFYLQDSFRFKSLALENLVNQQQNLTQEIQQFSPQPTEALGAIMDPVRKEQAVKLLEERTQELSAIAKIRIRKTVARTFFSLLLTGMGLGALGQVSARSVRSLGMAKYSGKALQLVEK
ncbi:hypothetical protein [Nodosilinea sp. E11]|uniref:hypothetical protein n=1 Tax=Nodosilinea sp. E11 TaxID=3037479 RepID=UPI00293437B3|nr:hypothetical protein [Nodosilinea sp. E11]WOD37911.1 hypothetical protein RRF56_16995 [Nodosilinea sp. E11]